MIGNPKGAGMARTSAGLLGMIDHSEPILGSVGLRQDVEPLAERIVDHLVQNVVPCKTLPGEEIRGDTTMITRTCIELAASMLNGQQSQQNLERLQEAAGQWAREGVPLDAIHHAIHEGAKVMVEHVAGYAADSDIDVLRETGMRLVILLRSITATIAAAYLNELRRVVGEHHCAAHTLATALLGGRPAMAMARECGIRIEDSYFVIAVAISKTTRGSEPVVDTPGKSERRLRLIESELNRRCQGALALPAAAGGTLLVPAYFGADNLDALVAQLANAAEARITATVMQSPTSGIPDAHEQVHELLRLVENTRRGPGLHRFADLALEYQITRPGPAQQFLRTVLDPLDEYPELLDTLGAYFQFDFNAKRAARALYIHQNTLSYRLKRIAELVGIDLSKSASAWYLRSAWAARNAKDLPEAGTCPHGPPPNAIHPRLRDGSARPACDA